MSAAPPREPTPAMCVAGFLVSEAEHDPATTIRKIAEAAAMCAELQWIAKTALPNRAAQLRKAAALIERQQREIAERESERTGFRIALSEAAAELSTVAGPIANRIRVTRQEWQERWERAEAEVERLLRENQSLRAECGLRQIRGYNEGKASAEAEVERLTKALLKIRAVNARVHPATGDINYHGAWADCEAIANAAIAAKGEG